ncbi:hypothetical protein [Pseudonocardia sp. ICBG601]|uniref:hypothetical protein n=1 Tax=Pseudonocardia sp. ICBG601 TaxID=2846759 RepID=UPI001CF7163E|nr:hypothetical protein [Pseudonocardia sp. ICBG601]
MLVAICWWCAGWVARFVAGRVLVGSRATDATFVHQARQIDGGWWASRAGWVRSSARLSPLLGVVVWAVSPAAALLLGAGALLLSVGWGLQRWREAAHERRWVAPLWPAVVEILGGEVVGAPPRSWIVFPLDPAAPDAVIEVGLPDGVVGDARRAAALRELFGERLELGAWVEQIESQKRLVTFCHRPVDPVLWAPVAVLFGLDPADDPAVWIEMPVDSAADDAVIRIVLPDECPDDVKLTEALVRIADQRLPKRWRAQTDHQGRVCVLVRRHPDSAPPRLVDLSAGAFPEVDELLAEVGLAAGVDLGAGSGVAEDLAGGLVDEGFEADLVTGPTAGSVSGSVVGGGVVGSPAAEDRQVVGNA